MTTTGMANGAPTVERVSKFWSCPPAARFEANEMRGLPAPSTPGHASTITRSPKLWPCCECSIDPALEPAVNGYISFKSGVKGFYVGGSKKTPTNIKMEVELVGSTGRLLVDNSGDGRDENGEWTGTYHANATIWREPTEQKHYGAATGAGEEITEASPGFAEYIGTVTPPQGGKGAPMIGIAAAVHDLINVLSSPVGGEAVNQLCM